MDKKGEWFLSKAITGVHFRQRKSDEMSVELNIPATLLVFEDEGHKDAVLEVNGRTVGECFRQFLANKPTLKKDLFDKTGELDSDIYVFVNNSPAALDPLNKVVKNGDKVKIMYIREKS
jgi:molybdopterin converting factor small subunit